MSWSLHHERTAFMAAMIDKAADEPGRALELTDTEAAELDRLFGDRDGFLLAVRHRWMTTLTAKLDQAAHDDISPQQVRSELAERNPGLRALLDMGLTSSVRVRALRHGEQQVLDLYTGPAIVRRTA